MSSWRLSIQLVVFAILLLALDAMVRSYGQRHFNPFVKLNAALERGVNAPAADPCIVLSGGSEMASAMDERELAAALVSHGVGTACVADLSIGGASIDVRFMALRAYVRRGGRLDTLVLGFRGSAVADASELAPGYYVGNNAAVYDWSTLGDLATYYRRPSFAAIDNAVRLALFRWTSIGANRQAFWARVDALESSVGLRPKVATNRFGVVDEFMKMAVAAPPAATTDWHLGRWYVQILDLAASRRARVVFLRLPALARAEQSSFGSPGSRRSFDAFVERIARGGDGRYVDLSTRPWVEDSLIIDGLHFNARGAQLVSRSLGDALAAGGGR